MGSTSGMNRYFDHGQHLHGSREACRLHCRAWALVWNFAPWHPATTRKNQNRRCPTERLNQRPVSRLLAAKPVDLRVHEWIPMSTPTKSVTVSKDWLMRCAEHERSDMVDLVDDALAAYAKARDFESPSKR